MSGLASQLNNIKAERLSVIADPTKLPSGHRQLSVRVSDEGDHDVLKKKVTVAHSNPSHKPHYCLNDQNTTGDDVAISAQGSSGLQ